MLNRVVIMGRLGRNPELRTTTSGVQVASFTLAVDRDYRDKDTGERVTDWIDVVAWRQTAEFIGRHIEKGSLIVVEGRLQVREWTKDGKRNFRTEVVADNVYFGERKRTERSQEPQEPQEYGMEQLETPDGDLPF